MQRHVILTLGRSGSNTLVNLINQSPDVLNIGEVLGDWNRVRQVRDKLGLYRGDDATYLDAVTRPSGLLRIMNTGRSIGRLVKGKVSEIKTFQKVSTLGFKEFATLMADNGQRDWLSERADVKVIGLERKDVLARLISWQMLDETGVVRAATDQNAGTTALTLVPERIEGLIATVEDENTLLNGMLDALPSQRVYRVTYEEFYRDPESRRQALTEIFAFLDVSPCDPEIRMRKIIARPPQEMIANRVDCAAALKGTRFEGMLD
ncbi:MAG: hypothetical protein QNJ03_01015 [Dinoroseobacter sp.]|nr:hypothetical protein [Dinoroseobacter sp.]